jgi:putative endonuclease
VNSPPSSARTPAQRRGTWAEQAAERALLAQGLRLVARNVRCKAGEIDLIMWDGPVLVFVEVRFRRNSGFGSALDSVNVSKQARIRRAALWWLVRHHTDALPACRFDVYAFDGENPCWVKSAFTA